jgi:hypothetical protein
LLKCADLVVEIDSLSRNFSQTREVAAEATYASLSVGQLQTLGYLDTLPACGTIALPKIRPSGIRSVPAANGYKVHFDAVPHQTLVLVPTQTSFGGRRWWFVCGGVPGASCGRKVLKMYRREGQDFYACHDCHKDAGDHGWRSAKDRSISAAILQPATVEDTHSRRHARSA